MINKKLAIWSCVISFILGISCPTSVVRAEPSATKIYSESQADALFAALDTELFNLVTNRTSLSDNKNHFDRKFSISFDMLLSRSKLAKTDGNGIPIRKRLLSGPVPRPKFLTDLTTGKHYVYYEACQAHACDETRLALLYEPETNVMHARLLLDKKEEFLGEVTLSEKKILNALKVEQ